MVHFDTMTYRQSLYQLMVSLIIALAGSGFAVSLVMAAPPGQAPPGELYIVQTGDWLSKIAEKYYQDPAAYPLIVVATNFKANSDPTFAYITTPEALEVGQKLWIPARPPAYEVPAAPNILTPVAELSALSPGALAFSPDDQWLAVDDGQGVQLWQTQNWQLRWSVPLTDVAKVAFSPDGQRLGSVGFDGTARLWAAATGQAINQLTYGHWVWGLDFSSDSQLWATGSFDRNAILADAVTGQPLKSFKHDLPVRDLALSPNGPWLALMLNQDWGPGRVVVWDIFSEEQRTLAEFRLWAYSNVVFSPDGQWLAAGLAGDDRVVAIWQTGTWPQVARLEVAGSIIDQLEFSPDGRRLAGLAANSNDSAGRVWVWEVPTWRLISTITLPDIAGNMAFSPDGRRLAIAVGQERTLEWQLWDIEPETLLVRIPENTGAVRFSHNGRFIAAAGENGVKVWQVTGGE